jgi:hypothetical protein
MTIKLRIPRPLFPGFQPGQPALAAASPLRAGATFHAALTDSMEEWVVRGASSSEPISNRFVARPAEPAKPGFLVRAWTWLQKRAALTVTKRLRVAETVSLGEKRFVALISVEGREFLIGGGTAGVSLLAQLGAGTESANAVRPAPGVEGDPR